MAKCVNCGMEIGENVRFCTNCGASQMRPPTAGSYEKESTGYGGTFQSEAGQGAPYQSGAAPDGSFQGGYGQDAFGAGNGSAADTGSVEYAGPVPAMTVMEAVATCFSKYVTFSGRARRCEFWYYTLVVFAVNIVLGWIGNAIFGAPEAGRPNMLQGFFSLLIFLPSTAVFWRRMHDIGKSGLWFFLNLIPVIGTLILLAFELTDSAPGENKYGMSPKYPLK